MLSSEKGQDDEYIDSGPYTLFLHPLLWSCYSISVQVNNHKFTIHLCIMKNWKQQKHGLLDIQKFPA